MTTTKNKALTGLAAAAILLTPGLAAPAVSAAAHLTKAIAAATAKRDALAATAISGGDTVKINGCRAIRGGAYTCQVELIPVHSSSRCYWTSTVRLVKGKPTVATYSRAHCSN